jgi:hypothetical protein
MMLLHPTPRVHIAQPYKKMLIYLDKYFAKADLVDFTVEQFVFSIAYLIEEGKSPNAISTYITALPYYLTFKGKPGITNNFIISKLVNGAIRLAAGPDIRRPIIVTVLGLYYKLWHM